MNADIKGALEQLNTSWKAFEHDGKKLTKSQVKAILEYGLAMGYVHTGHYHDREINAILFFVK